MYDLFIVSRRNKIDPRKLSQPAHPSMRYRLNGDHSAGKATFLFIPQRMQGEAVTTRKCMRFGWVVTARS